MKRFKAFLPALLALALLAGCSPTSGVSPSEAAGAAPSEAPAPAERTVIDAAGRAVEIPETVSSIVCVNVGALRYTAYMDALDLVAGVEENEPGCPITKPFSYFNQALFSSLPITGNNGVTYDEEIVKIGPDVIIANTDGDSADSLQSKTGIPVVVIPHNEGMFDENAFATLRIMGEVYGREDRAAELTAYLQGIRDDLEGRTASIPDAEKPSVYVAGVSYKGSHGFEGTEAEYPPLAAVHGVNLADQTGQTGPFNIDPEQVLAWDPDVIFLDYSGMPLIGEDYAANPSYYQGLTAVREGRLYAQISFRYNATNTELALADAYYLGKVLYPDAFADVDVAAKFDEIFKTLLGVEGAYAQFEAAGYRFQEMELK